MEQFVVSARKYRPTRFDEVVGQQGVTVTLKNAIKQNQLAHAFLFCGPRGVGKTTCARILAKTINCESPTEDFEACGKCNSCLALSKNSSLNIFEMDAASNSHVEDIRSLTDQVRYAPQNGKYKIYIIDEVHMLSTNAFNAFLKTLEEPPPYTKFILATTEKHKILPTILSRCQIFDFSRITIEDIVNHLEEICQKEQIKFEPEALHLIAQKADGGLRDALSVFDRMVSFGNGNITYQLVADNLNVLDHEFYFSITDFLLTGDTENLLLSFDKILRKGFEGDLFLNGLSEHFRNLLVAQSDRTLSLLETSGKLKEKYLEQATQTHPAYLLNWANIASNAEFKYKDSRNKRLLVELALMKMAAIQSMFRVTEGELPEVKKKTVDIKSVDSDSQQSEDQSDKATDSPEKPMVEEQQSHGYEQPKAEKQETVNTDSEPKVQSDHQSSSYEKKNIETKERLKHLQNLIKSQNQESQTENQAQIEREQEEAVESGLPEVIDPGSPTEAELLSLWEFAVLRIGKSSLINTFDKEGVKIKLEDNALKVEIGGGESVLKEHIEDIIKVFRKALEQPALEAVIINDQNSRNFAGDRPFTAEDKLRYFIQKNPKLEKLQKKLQLRLDL